MIADGELFFEDAKLRISFKGRLFLMNSSMEGYKEVPDFKRFIIAKNMVRRIILNM